MKKQAATSIFTHNSSYPCSAEELYLWHSRNGALERLLPPWETTTVLSKQGGIDPGGRVMLKMHAGLIPFHFHAHHVENVHGKMFRDVQEKGPFSSWSHSHFFEDRNGEAWLQDRVEYALPGHRLLPEFMHKHVRKSLARMFAYREKTLQLDIALHNRYSKTPLRILVSGSSGVLGRELIPLLTTGGHQVWTLVRRKPNAEKNEIHWDPEKGVLNEQELPELDAVIHLAGEYIGLGRWQEERKQRVVDSRVNGTNLLARTIATRKCPPKVFLCASAVGYYGDCQEKWVDESYPEGKDFISKVCTLWEESAGPAQRAGIRTVFMRLGVGLTPRGGGLQRILASAPFGFIRRFGSGKQYISWMSTDDMVSAMLHCLTCETLDGPVNIAAPEPITNLELMRTVAKVTKRPLLFPIPATILTTIYGQMASEILLSGCRVSTKKLQDSGFTFRHPTLEIALRSLLSKYDTGKITGEQNR